MSNFLYDRYNINEPTRNVINFLAPDLGRSFDDQNRLADWARNSAGNVRPRPPFDPSLGRWFDEGAISFDPAGFGGGAMEQIKGGGPGERRPQPNAARLHNASFGGQPGTGFHAEIPPYFEEMFGGDVEAFHNWWQTIEPWQRPLAIANASSAYDKAQDKESADNRALEGLRSMFGRVETSMNEHMADPSRLALEESIRARSDPGYEIITDIEEGDMRNRLAQTIARGDAGRMASAAARGVSSSGPTTNARSSAAAVGDAGAAQLRAQIEGSNRAARGQAESQLVDFINAGFTAEQAYLGVLKGIQSEITAIEQGGDYTPVDVVPWNELGFAREAYERESGRADRELDLFAESAQMDATDFLELIQSSVGTGIWEGIIGSGGGGGFGGVAAGALGLGAGFL